jgi:L-alanine-DL-glutamate epimerase-like enolase superfamily enzyme
MQVTQMRSRHFKIPPSVPWQDAALKVAAIDFVILELETDNDLVGYGLGYTVGPGSSAIRALLEDGCADHVIGQDPSDFRAVHQSIGHYLHRAGQGIGSCAMAAIDIALWDLVGKHRRLPLYKLIGKVRESIAAYESGIDLFLTSQQLEHELVRKKQRGAKAVKIKVGRKSLQEDIERLDAARRVFGAESPLMLDANQCWELNEARRRMKAFERFEPYWLEEPLNPADIAGHAELRHNSPIPIAVGEALYTADQFLAYLKADASDIYQPDVVRVGGITSWLKISNLCEVWGRPVAPHYMSELSVHLLCATSNGLFVEVVNGGTFSDLGVCPALTILDGHAFPPSVPGNGLVFDWNRLEPFEVRA